MPLTKVPTWLFIMDGPVKTVFYHMMSRVPHTLLTHYYSLCMSGNCFYLFDTCRTSRPIHTCTQYVCLRASQFESESKTRAADQYVCLRASQFESESKTSKSRPVRMFESITIWKRKQDKSSRPVCMFESITIWKRKQDKSSRPDQYVCLDGFSHNGVVFITGLLLPSCSRCPWQWRGFRDKSPP